MAGLAFTLAGSAQAIQGQLGLQLNAAIPTGFSSLASAGAHASVLGPVGADLLVRGTLEGNLGLHLLPNLRLDIDLLKTNADLYYGAGIGTGLSADLKDGGSGFPNAVLSPVALLNIHGVLGKTFGNGYVEGLLRAGPTFSVGLRYGVNFR